MEAGLVERVEVGNLPLDFDAFFAASQPRLLRALTAGCGDSHLAADCVQEAFVQAHLRWSQVAAYDKPDAWVRRVAINKLRDHLRRRERRERLRRRLAGLAVESPGDPAASVGGEVDDLLARLPRQQRLTVAMHYLEDLSVADIGQLLGISEGTVKFHLHQARAKLRPLLRKDQNGMP